MTGRRWSDEDIAAVCQAAEDGRTQKAIAIQYGVTETAIRKLLERQRNPSGSSGRSRWTEEKIAEVRYLANSGWKIGAIAVHFGVSGNAIYKLLVRTAAPPARQYKRRARIIRRGQSPLADPLVAALFKHHRERAPDSLLRRLLPAPLGLPTNLLLLRNARMAKPKPRVPVIITPPSPLLPPRKYPSLQSIMERVLIANDLSRVDFMARTRAPRSVEARSQFFVLAAQETVNSLAEIGRFVDRDHTTVLHAITRYCETHNISPPRGQVLNRSLRSRMAAERAAEARACA